MRVFVAGATGVLGRRLVKRLAERGHTVVGMVRRQGNEETIRSAGGEPRTADLFDADSLARAADGCEVLVHAATAIPVAQKIEPSAFSTNDRVRRDGIRAMTRAAENVGARALLFQSVAWLGRPASGAEFDETAPFNGDPILISAVDAEQHLLEFASRTSVATPILRGGWFYGPDCAHTILIGRELKRWMMPVLGRGDALWSVIHIDDMAEAFVCAIEAPRTGIWHVVDGTPVRVADFLDRFATELGARRPMRIPALVARIVAGQSTVDFLTSSTRTYSTRFQADYQWAPQNSDYTVGLRQISAAWRDRPSGGP